MTNAAPHLTSEQVEALGEELDALRQRLIDDLGERDVNYIRNVIRAQRGLDVAGRGLLFLSFIPGAWAAGTTALGFSKIIDNMEIGHNLMHGQYDWTGDPTLSGHKFEWDTVCPSEHWRHSHNYVHHTYTNIIGKDRDIGYGLLRMTKEQRWMPAYLLNPLNALMLCLFFEWGVALHDLETDNMRTGKQPWTATQQTKLKRVWEKVRGQVIKDYVLFPALAGPEAPAVLAGNVVANLMRNVWSFMIIFCGHFPDDVAEFTEEETDVETRGEWYIRQMLGSSNISGSKFFHLMSGNLSHQIEHHIFPDIPAHRYAEISVEVREICKRYGLIYNTGPLSRQFGQVVRKIVRLSFPGPEPELRKLRAVKGGGQAEDVPETAAAA